jgi:hypothetical protein
MRIAITIRQLPGCGPVISNVASLAPGDIVDVHIDSQIDACLMLKASNHVRAFTEEFVEFQPQYFHTTLHSLPWCGPSNGSL